MRTSLLAACAAPFLGLTLLGTAHAAPQATSAGAQGQRPTKKFSAPYRVLDRVEGAYTDLALMPIRPMLRDASTGQVFVLDAERSELLAFDAAGTQIGQLRLPWGPVALCSWSASPMGPKALLIVCRGSHSLAVVDAATLNLLDLIPLSTEPGDILVEPSTNHAFVAGSALDLVQEIDIAAMAVIKDHKIPSKRPTFLALDGNTVLVAPMLSGNNSMADTGSEVLDVGPGRVIDLEDNTQALQGLPDHDLFRITPGGGVEAVATDTGAVLFGLGVHPTSGDVWQLGTEAKNKDPMRVGEPAVRGDFIQNRLAIMALSPGNIVAPSLVNDLDDADPNTIGVQFSAARSVGQPYALAFDAAGAGYVTGLLSNNITQLDSGGQFVREWNVGDTPRGILVDSAGQTAWVYAWNSRQVEIYDLSPNNPLQTGVLPLGVDPTPALIAAGRSLFFDGSHSEHANASCASCHIETESDMLVWDLSNMPYDDKGPLATQTMRGIADLGPFHWRGERPELSDFNGAFDGLLGGTPLDLTPGGDFDAFTAYIFALEQPANPHQHSSRKVVNYGSFKEFGQQVLGDAVKGQDHYFDTTIIQNLGSCNVCHPLPTGTSNEVTLDEPNLQIPRRNHFVVASYNGLWRKEQATLEQVTLAGGVTEMRPTLGTGTSASGLKDSLLDFVRIPLFSAPDKVRRDITAFLTQLDSGLAPAVHSAWMLSGPNAQADALPVSSFLIPQARLRNCDVVLMGTVDLGTGPRQLGWLYNPVTGLFHSDSSAVVPQPISFFVDQAVSGLGTNLALGLPVGMGARYALDTDFDGLGNADELSLGTDPDNADTDGDGDLDGHEVANGGDPLDPGNQSSDSQAPSVSNVRVVFVTSTVAKIQFDTDELATWSAGWTSGQQSGTATGQGRERTHTAILTGLRGDDKTHAVTLDVTDLGGNTTQVVVSDPVQTTPAIPIPSTVFRNASTNITTDSNGTLAFSVQGKARLKFGPLLPGQQLRVQVFVNGVLTQPLVTGTISNGVGDTTVQISETGLSVGDVITVTVIALRDMASGNDAGWSFPDTAEEFRSFALPYTGTGP